MTPSRPAPSNSSNQRCAVARSVVAGVTWIDGPDPTQRVDQCRAALGERPIGVVVVAEGQQVERDERRRRLLGQHPHPRIGRVDALLQRLEIQAVVGGDDDLAVDHAALRQLGDGRGDQLGKVAGHRFLVAAADLHLIAVAEKNRPEPVPFGLIRRVRRDRFHRFGQHRRNRRHDRQVHLHIVLEPCAGIGRWHRQRRKSTSTGSRSG